MICKQLFCNHFVSLPAETAAKRNSAAAEKVAGVRGERKNGTLAAIFS